jgi:hypothetical protein
MIIEAAANLNESPKQRAYHFVSLGHGLDDLRQRHLKIAQIDDLNDPFELFVFKQSDRRFRQANRATKQELAQQHGLLCFSLDWHNPLMWSHYADRHRGLALGFDVDQQILKQVSYIENRPFPNKIDIEVAHSLLFTKYAGWNYEREARIYTSLEDRDPKTGLYFGEFGEQLVLREVIAGPLCEVTEQELRNATGSTTKVKFRKARLAFKTFRVVTNLRGFGGPDSAFVSPAIRK